MRHSKSLRYDLLAGLFLAVLVILLYGQAVFTPGELAYGQDTSYFYPHEVILQASGFGADFPLWNPYFGAGAPGLGKIQVGMLYPPLVILRALFDVEMTLDLDAALHLFLAGLGIYLLMRQLKVGQIPALFTAVAFMLSGSFTPRILAGHASVLRVLAWSGWLLWAYIRLLKRGTLLNIILTALIIGFVILGGHPQMSLMVLLLPLGYFGVYFLPGRIRTKKWRELAAGFGRSVGVVGLALGLTAVQILPYLAWVGQTVRSAGNAFDSFDLLIRHSVWWHDFLSFIMPTIWFEPAGRISLGAENPPFFWEISAFTGVLTLLIIGIGLVLRSNIHRGHRWFFGGVAVVGLVLSMGTINPLYEFVFEAMPYFRAPGRFMFLWALATAVLAGLVLDIWLKNPSTLPRLNKLVVGLAAAALLLLAGWRLLQPTLPDLLQNYLHFTREAALVAPQTVGQNVNALAVKLGILAILFLPVGRWREYGRYLGLLLVIALTVEMSVFTREFTEPMPLTTLYLPGSRYSQLDYSVAAHRFDGYRQPPLYLVASLTQLHNGEESSKLDNLLQSDNGLNLLAANFIITEGDFADGQLVQTKNGWNLFSHWQNLPRIYAAPTVQLVSDEAAALQLVGDAAFSGWQEAIVVQTEDQEQAAQLELLLAKPENGEPADFSGRYLTYGNNRLVAEVTTSQPMMVVFSEMYDADWQAEVNGRSANLWLVNYAFRGVIVEPGTSTIVMQYRPQAYRLGAVISGGTGLLLLAAALYQFVMWRRGMIRRKGAA
ncbi:MAG: YfhO family protein [Ardenticatenaceae bacterium]|nr:YfhO family protein [Ardenticatenaceae bacterium]